MVAQMVAGIAPVPCSALSPNEGMSDFVLRGASKPAVERLQKLNVPSPGIGRIESRPQLSPREEIRDAVERMQTGRQHRDIDEYIGEKRLGMQDISACDRYL